MLYFSHLFKNILVYTYMGTYEVKLLLTIKEGNKTCIHNFVYHQSVIFKF